jgi:phage major head subunit gpT-like protein
MLTEAQNLAAVRTELDRVFKQNFEYDDTTPSIATANTSALFKPMTIDRQAYIEEIYKGGGLFPQIGEVGTVPVSDIKVANKLITPVLDFADSRELSKNWFDDQLHNLWTQTVSDMAMKARITQDVNAFSIFRGAFTTTLTADGAALIASHTLLNGQTYSNVVTGALSPSTLNDAIVKLRQQPDQAGVVLGNAPAYLVVPSKLFKHAIEITQSALIADVANNNVNVYRSIYGLTVYSSPYLDYIAGFTSDGSDTAWYLLAKNHSITRMVRQGLQTFLRDWGFSNNRTYNYQANFRETVYVPDYIGVVGATGV